MIVVSLSSYSQIVMPRVFSDNMVLQRDKNVALWGTSKANVKIMVNISDIQVVTMADINGKWMAYLPPMVAGGPFKIEISEMSEGKITSAVRFKNVLFGDVWLASGQSNMEFRVRQGMNATEEIKSANYPSIRFFIVPDTKQTEPQTDVPSGSWQLSDSTNTADFSAVAYFFSKQIHLQHNVPVGIIQTSWGGTPVEAWTSKEMLMTVPEMRSQVLKNMADSINQTTFDQDVRNNEFYWNTSQDSQNGIKTVELNYDDSNFSVLEMPKVMTDWGIGHYEGVVWLRKMVDLNDNFLHSDLTINLGYPEMMYNLYFNGNLICEKRWNSQKNHVYTIPASMIKQGKNVIAMRMAVLWGGGGFAQPVDSMYLASGNDTLSIADNWKYIKDLEPPLPKVNNYHYYPTYLYNAMINPFVPYGLKGFLWYQGEANVDRAKQYQTLFPLMINDWRIRFKQGNLPFVYVQLANFMRRYNEPTNSKWAELREAQTMALSLPNTAMATIVDVGEADDIHPKNKQVVGLRLALAANGVAYGDDAEFSGPQFDSLRIEKGGFRLYFTHIGSGLMSKDNKPLTGFAMAGNDGKFFWADAVIENNTLFVKSINVKEPHYVRFAWADNPEFNFYNKEGLPAVPFRAEK